MHISPNVLAAFAPCLFLSSSSLNGTGAHYLRGSPAPLVLVIFHTPHGAPSEEIYAVRSDLVQHPISVQ